MILIHPPVAKPAEPPAGIAKLSGALSLYGIQHTVIDANLEALLSMITGIKSHGDQRHDKWMTRALRNISENHEALKSRGTYRNIDRYKRAVIDLNRALEHLEVGGGTPGIANYRHSDLSPLRSNDLIRAAEDPEGNPFYRYFRKRLPPLIEKNTTRFIGFSLNYLSQALCTFAMIGFLKRHFQGLSCILGGGLVTSWMNNPLWENPFKGLVDHLAEGPGEGKLLSILGAGDMKERHVRPDYAALPLDDYLAPGRILPYSASSGCCWSHCSFCPEKAENSRYIPVPVHTVLDDLNVLIGETGPGLLHILDNSISETLLRRLAENGIPVPWYGFTRISRLLTDIDFCMKLKRSGCIMLKLGLESGDQEVIDRMHKGIDIGTASLVLKTLRKAGIRTYIYLIFGTPAESLPGARKTLDFVVRHKDDIGFLNVALFNMPICGPEVSQYKTSNFYEGDLSFYTNFSHPRGWNRKEVRRFLDTEFRKHPAVSEILRKEPPVFTSNHAPFFVM